MKGLEQIKTTRDLNKKIQLAIYLSITSAYRLLFSKKTIGIVLLCVIPIIVFGLWIGGAFPQETENLYENQKGDYNNLYENQVLDLQQKYGKMNIIKNELNISIEISEVKFQPIISSGEEDLYSIYIRGRSEGNVNILNLSMILYIYDFSLPLDLSIIGPVENNYLRFIGQGEPGNNYWQNWEFEFKNLTIPVIDESMLQRFGINLNNFQGDESPIRFGIIVQAIDNGSLNGNGIIWNFIYEEIYIEIDETGISDYGIVGRDIKEKIIDISGYDVFYTVAPNLYFVMIIPLITLLYSISVIREDIENHNIVYLISRPISKNEILLYKFKGFFLSTWVLIAVSLTISFCMIALNEPGEAVKYESFINILLISILYILVYGALFFIFTLITSYPIVVSLLFVFVWENIISSLPSVLNRLSISYWIKSLGHELLPKIDINNVYLPLSVLESAAVLIVTTIAFLIIAMYLFNNQEFT